MGAFGRQTGHSHQQIPPIRQLFSFAHFSPDFLKSSHKNDNLDHHFAWDRLPPSHELLQLLALLDEDLRPRVAMGRLANPSRLHAAASHRQGKKVIMHGFTIVCLSNFSSSSSCVD